MISLSLVPPFRIPRVTTFALLEPWQGEIFQVAAVAKETTTINAMLRGYARDFISTSVTLDWPASYRMTRSSTGSPSRHFGRYARETRYTREQR
jgi:hypothetical protein